MADSNVDFQPTKIVITIDGKKIETVSGKTIFEVAEENGIHINHLCHHPRLPPTGKCGVCVVEVENNEMPMRLSCSTKVEDGMIVSTKSIEVITRSGNATRNFLANTGPIHRVTDNPMISKLYDLADNAFLDTSSNSIRKDTSKCVSCSRCVRACTEQGISCLENVNDPARGNLVTVNGKPLEDSGCVACGQCTTYCPTQAMTENSHIEQVIEAIESGKIVVVQTAPAPRVAIGECFGLPPGTISTGKMVTAAKRAGFSYVFDTNFAADMTIMEEGTEFLHRLTNGGVLPMFTSCCPAWINYVEKRYPEFIPNISTARSPGMEMAAIIKTYWAERMGIDPENIYSVLLMPCTAKKDEISRPQFIKNGKRECDASLTTREFAVLLEKRGITASVFKNLLETPYDSPLGESTGAAAIFGVTGGVMEAALRTAYEIHTKKTLEDVKFHDCRGFKGVKEAEVDMDGTKIKIAVVNGLGRVRPVLEKIKKGESQYHFIEVMSCPGGCIGGGGQPQSENPDILAIRAKAIYQIDETSKKRKSHENESLNLIYQRFLGKPNHGKAHELLHTYYTNRKLVSEEKGTTAELKEGDEGVSILYGSQAGRTAGIARNLAHTIRQAKINVRCFSMNEYDINNLVKEKHVLFLTSTYGEGEFPDNAKKFFSALSGEVISKGALANVNYAVVGFGSSDYKKFCEAAILIDNRMKELGAIPVLDLLKCDEKDVNTSNNMFEEWKGKALKLVGGKENVNNVPVPKFLVSVAVTGKKCAPSLAYCPNGYSYVKLVTNELLTPKDYDRPVGFFEFDLTGSGLTYNVGDHIYILPKNSESQVNELIDFIGLDPELQISVTLTDPSSDPNVIFPPIVTIRELFAQYLDLNGPVQRALLELMARYSQDHEEKKQLSEMLSGDAQDKEKLAQFCSEYTNEQTIKKFANSIPPIEQLVSVIPCIKPRAYSIGSASSMHPHKIQLVIVNHQFKKPSGVWQNGLCTKFLFGLDASKQPLVAVQVHTGLLIPPEDPMDPIIMAGLGTGIAPFRAFLQHREMQKKEGKEMGPALLYYGCRHKTKDYLYDSEWTRLMNEGILTQLVTAFSHDQAHFIFVQDKVNEDPETAFKFFSLPRIQFFYCGPAMGVPQAVMEGFKQAMVKVGGMKPEEAENYLNEMTKEGRVNIESF